jgi:hypothetical protein
MRQWLRLALSGEVVRRALRTALVVGALLAAINHSDAILSGAVEDHLLARIALSFFVPYAVSTASSVGALRQRAERDSVSRPPTP